MVSLVSGMDEGSLNNVSSALVPGEIIELRSRLWRIDSISGDVLDATPIDGHVLERQKFYIPFEHVIRGELPPPSADVLGEFSSAKTFA